MSVFIFISLVLVGNSSIIHTKPPIQLESNDPTAQELLKLTGNNCQKIGGDYNMEYDLPAAIPICKLNGAIYFKADMSVDCDGVASDKCNQATDSDYQDHTSLNTSTDRPLDAAALPYVVLPRPSGRWNYKASGIKLGDVVAVIYNSQVRYGIFGDEGGPEIIGEASYAMVESFGIKPDPQINAVPRIAVTYIVFPGAQVSPVENHESAVTLGIQLANKLLQDNKQPL